MTITISRITFAGKRLTLDQMQQAQAWAVGNFNRVCNVQMRIVTSGTIRFHSYASNDAAGRASENNVWLSVVRPISDIPTMASVIMHEICHCWGFPGALRWGHYPNEDRYRDRIMHPAGANDRWWHPVEVVALQRKYGLPSRPFRIWEVDRLAKVANDYHRTVVIPARDTFRKNRTPSNLERLEKARSRHSEFIAARDYKAAIWLKVPRLDPVYLSYGIAFSQIPHDDPPPMAVSEPVCRFD
jgi:hypothetical protein